MQPLPLSQPLLIKDKSVVGVLLPNTSEFIDVFKQFVSNLKFEKQELDKWIKEIESPEANARYDAIVADADANDGWVKAEDVEKEFLISSSISSKSLRLPARMMSRSPS